jgi:hypothetical protein
MKRRILWLSAPILLGLLVAVLAVVVPAQASKPIQTADTNGQHPRPGVDTYGVIESFPKLLIGSWTVDGVAYAATTSTHFSTWGGPFYVGACVRVRYDPNTYTAHEVAMVESDRCSQGASNFYVGLINQVPEGYDGTVGISGTWVISDVEFLSTTETRLRTQHGALVVGACAGVVYREVNGVNVAYEIGTMRAHHCFRPESFNQAYGYVVTFPDDLVGAWMISDTAGMTMSFVTTQTSHIETRQYPLEIDACVRVRYFSNLGINYAFSVNTTNPLHCEGDFSDYQPPSKIIASVEAMPPIGTMTGTWILAGLDFTATEQTRIEEANGPLAVGVCAAAKYDPTNGAMLIHKLASEEVQDCLAQDGSPRFKLFGVVEMMPTEGYPGTWQVSGVSFTVTPSTTLESRHGDFAMGAYVKVIFTYDPVTGERTAQVVKTHAGPGCGRLNYRGRYGGWKPSPLGDQIILDGKPLQADPDIDVEAGIQKGDMVWVNVYRDPDGEFVTQVLPDQSLFLPIVQHLSGSN